MPLIELIGVKKFYRKTVAVDIASFSIEKGESIFLQGSNGSGKSTLLRIFGGFTSISSGTIKRTPEFSAMRIGYVPQSGGVYDDLTFRQNLALYRRLYGLSVYGTGTGSEFIDVAGLGPFLDTTVGELSGGLRHAATLACVLDVVPDALLLDEPASDLDSVRQDALWHVLKEISKTLSFIVMASHGVDRPAFLHKRIALERGKLA